MGKRKTLEPSVADHCKITKSEENVSMESQLAGCVGPCLILKYKLLMRQQMANKESVTDSNESKESKETRTRIIQHSKSMERPEETRTVVGNGGMPQPRTHSLDICSTCQRDRIVNKEWAKRSCPQCGDGKDFASHLFDIGEECDGFVPTVPSKKPTNLQKMIAQFEKGFPRATTGVLEKLSIDYQSIHCIDPYKVTALRTGKFMKSRGSQVPKIYQRASHRVSKELTASSIREYSHQEVNEMTKAPNLLEYPPTL